MTEFVSLSAPLPGNIPDDLTVAQFMLDTTHPSRPVRLNDSPWLVEDATGRNIAYEEIRVRVFGLANALSLKWNVVEDDVVCIFSPNHVDYPVVIWAIHRLGANVTAANPSFTAEELAYQLATTKAVSIVAHPASLPAALAAAKVCGIPPSRVIPFEDGLQTPTGLAPNINELIKFGLGRDPNFVERRLNPGEAKTKIALLSFSSGTTGKPKAVEISHYAPIANLLQIAAHMKINEEYTSWEHRRFRPGDVGIAVLPFFHIYGLVVTMHFLLFAGQTLVVVPKFEFTKFLDSIVKYRVTHLCLVPPQIVLLCKHPAVKNYDLSHIRWLFAGAAPISAELGRQIIKVVPNAHVGQGYGMTETCTIVTMFPLSQRTGTLGSAGQFIPGIKARVLKEDGSYAGAGEQGELIVTGPSMALRYGNSEQATEETFVDGWVRTGDEVIIDKNGDLFIIDRLKEIMKVRGFQVAPAELEGHLLTHPDVVDTCVVGIPDEYSGEVPLAFVVLAGHAAKKASSTPGEGERLKADIAKHVEDHKIYYKRLAGGVIFLDAIPKNPSGKLLRRVLREQAKKLLSSTQSPRSKL